MEETVEQPLFFVSGPTASGKSALALRLAADLGGEVLNADSVQVYTGCDIGSAKVSSKERAMVPHHLLDVCEPNKNYDAQTFVHEAEAVLRELNKRERVPIVCGGTTLYLKALLEGLADLPPGDKLLREEFERFPSAELFRRLEAVDPEAARRLHPNDRVRVIRALEVHAMAGTPQSVLHEAHQKKPVRRSALGLVLWWPRTFLYERINQRSQELEHCGIVEETRTLLDRYGAEIRVLQTVGYKQALEFIVRGELDREALIASIAMHTRRLAKRQMTFWRNEVHKLSWNVFPDEADAHAYLGSEREHTDSKHARKGAYVWNLSYSDLLERLEKEVRVSRETTEVWNLSAEAVFA